MSSVRWQALTIQQFSNAVNLILGLSLAVLGFQINLLTNINFAPSSCQKLFFTVSASLVFLSAAAGTLCTINRLRDFRETANTARAQERGHNDLADHHREQSRQLGKLTWRLFWFQAWVFFGGVLLLVFDFAKIFHDKLF